MAFHSFCAFALGMVTPWGQDSRSEAWFWEVSGKPKRSRLPPEYSPTHEVGNAQNNCKRSG